MKCSIIPSSDMHSQTQLILRSQEFHSFVFYILLERKQLQDFRFVFHKQIMPLSIPTDCHDHLMIQHHLFLAAIVFLFLIELNGRNQLPCGGIFRQDINDEIVIASVADMKPRVFIRKAHRHRRTSMFTAPSVKMSVLQYVIAHPSFIPNEYHTYYYLGTTLPSTTLNRSLNSSRVRFHRLWLHNHSSGCLRIVSSNLRK